MKKIILMFVIFSSNSFAIDFTKYKERLRAPMAKMLGEDLTENFLGKKSEENSSYPMPQIPEIKSMATDSSIYDKSGAIYQQGDEFNKLKIEDKRIYRVSFIKEIFKVTRNSEAKNDDIVTYLNVIEQGGSREGVYRRIVNDDVYRTLENYPAPVKEELVNFVIKYGEKYLGLVYSKNGIKKVNLYTVKKIVAAKTLDVVDALSVRPKDLYQWYANFSEELAKTFPGIFSGKARANTNQDFHYHWAKKVPFQHIKSEVLVKLHLTLNLLNN